MLPRLLKSALFGLLVAVCGLVVALGVGLQGLAATGAGGLGAVSFGISGTVGLLVMLTCFGLAFMWMYRRLSRRAPK